MNQQIPIEAHLAEPLGEATASLLLLEEEVTTLAERLGVGAWDHTRRLVRTQARTPMTQAVANLKRHDPPKQQPDLKNTALQRLSIAAEGTDVSQKTYRERLSVLGDISAPELVELRHGIDSSREAVAEALAAVTAMYRQLDAEKAELGRPAQAHPHQHPPTAQFPNIA
jgi:hypothetical protein